MTIDQRLAPHFRQFFNSTESSVRTLSLLRHILPPPDVFPLCLTPIRSSTQSMRWMKTTIRITFDVNHTCQILVTTPDLRQVGCPVPRREIRQTTNHQRVRETGLAMDCLQLGKLYLAKSHRSMRRIKVVKGLPLQPRLQGRVGPRSDKDFSPDCHLTTEALLTTPS